MPLTIGSTSIAGEVNGGTIMGNHRSKPFPTIFATFSSNTTPSILSYSDHSSSKALYLRSLFHICLVSNIENYSFLAPKTASPTIVPDSLCQMNVLGGKHLATVSPFPVLIPSRVSCEGKVKQTQRRKHENEKC